MRWSGPAIIVHDWTIGSGISPSTYCAAKKREENPSARDMRDEELKAQIMRVREKKRRKLYGAKKMWHELNRDGI